MRVVDDLGRNVLADRCTLEQCRVDPVPWPSQRRIGDEAAAIFANIRAASPTACLVFAPVDLVVGDKGRPRAAQVGRTVHASPATTSRARRSWQRFRQRQMKHRNSRQHDRQSTSMVRDTTTNAMLASSPGRPQREQERRPGPAARQQRVTGQASASAHNANSWLWSM